VLAGWLSSIAMPTAWGQAANNSANRAPLARYFPRQDLVVYAEFDGLDAHRDAWTRTALYRLLNETTTGALYERSLGRLLEIILRKQAGAPANGRELFALGIHVVRSGFAVGINRAGGAGPPRSFAVVLRDASRGAPRAIVDRLLRAGANPRSRVEKVKRPDGRELQVVADSTAGHLAWWPEGDDLVVSLVSPGGPDAIIGALTNREPTAVEHPVRTGLRGNGPAPGVVPVGVAFFDMAALPSLPKEAVALGLDGIKRFEYRWGFREGALESSLGVVAPAPRRGILSLFDQPALDVRHLPPLPGGLAGFSVLSLDAARFWDAVRKVSLAQEFKPGRAETSGLHEFENAFEQATGLRLREDLLANLGTRWTFYNVPTKINAPSHILEGFAQGFFRVPKMAVVIDVTNREPIARSLDRFVESMNRMLQSMPKESMPVAIGDLRPLKGEDAGFRFSLNSRDFPLTAGMWPTVVLGRKALVLASSPATALAARDLSDRSVAGGLPAGDPLAGALASLPENMTLLSVADIRQSMLPDVVVGLPGLVESLIKTRRLRGLPPFLSGMSIEEEPGGVAAEEPGIRIPEPIVDPELIPDSETLRPFLFPSIHALVVDDEGIRYMAREAFPTINPSTAVPVAIAMFVPAVRSAQMAARRVQSVNNLKQIALAFHNFESSNGQFPADIRSKDGKPLLSWRVQILPFLEQAELFNSFRLDEPWDSPHNKPLLERMPGTFAVPGSPAEPGMTFYRGFKGPGTIFEPNVPKGVRIATITDGTSNTIAVVEAKVAVPWTRPAEELPFDGDPKLKGMQALQSNLGGHFSGGFNAAFCDGSVRFIKTTVSLQVLRALITRNGGEVISSDSF
jgi:prepilin-type processing-associated H-X9-DG protein